jgi:hypothetical protein
VLPRGEDFNRLRSAIGQGIEQPGMKPLAQKNMCGHDSKHGPASANLKFR